MSIKISRNSWLKIASVMMASALWATVVIMGHSVSEIEVPLKFTNVADGLMVESSGTRMITVSLRGHERFFENLSPTEISVSLDMSEFGVGVHSYEVSAKEIKHPSTLRVVGIKPALLNLNIEKVIIREVPVRALITGVPMKGYATRGVEVDPGIVTLRGTKSSIGSIRWLDTNAVDIEGARANVTKDIQLNTSGKNISLSKDMVSVTVIVLKE